MITYWLITEPARRTSLRVDVPKGTWPEDALRAYADKWHPDTVAAWLDEPETSRPSLASMLADDSGDDVRLIEEMGQ
jgi:hypothetical protein